MSTPTWSTSGHARDKARTRLRRKRLPCWICGGPIDYTLKTPHPDSFELDHVLPVVLHPELGLDAGNHAPAHRRCNREKSDKLPGQIRQVQVPTSRDWL